MAGQVGSQAVDRAATLLAVIVESDEPRTFTSLVHQLGLTKSTASRLLQALERNRLVHRDRSGSFGPGPLFALYAARHDAAGDLVKLAQPALERLGEATGETVNLAVPRGGAVVQVAQVDSRYLLGATNWVGVDVPAHCSALGKVFYAFGVLPVPERDLERRTAASITSVTALRRELEGVARSGVAVAWEELEAGLVAVAVPLRDTDGTVVAAISVSGPTNRITRARAAKLGSLLQADATRLSAALGHHRGKEGVA
jgi:IclR family acetate operon transcriptional repressor